MPAGRSNVPRVLKIADGFAHKTIRIATRASFCLCGMMLSACLGPITLDQAVLAYNEATTDALSKQLLLNIAGARHHQPMHFPAVSNIAATFNFQLSAGVTPALTGDDGGLLAPIFGGSVSENQTISLIPVEGEEFTKRLLAPFQETKMTLLLRQGVDIDLLLRMVADEFRIKEGGREIAYHNRPSDRFGYPMFRRIVLHLSSIQDRIPCMWNP